MSNQNINTSRAKKVDVEIFDHDNLPLSATYTSASVAIDLTDYRFDFYLKRDQELLKTYTITAGSLSTAFLTKMGGGVNILDMEAMWEDIQANQVNVDRSKAYRLIQVTTDTTNVPYTYIVFNINASKY